MESGITHDCVSLQAPWPSTETVIEPGALYGARPLVLQRTGYVGERVGWDNPHGVTVTFDDGFGVRAHDWRSFAEELSWQAQQKGVDLTGAAAVHPNYYRLGDYAETSVAGLHYIGHQVAEGHRVYKIGYSKGGLSGAMAAEAVAGEGLLHGFCEIATPVSPLEFKPHKLGKLLMTELRELPKWGEQPKAENLAGFMTSVGSHIMKRALLDPKGIITEVESIRQFTNAKAIARLSQQEDFLTGTILYDNDGVVPILEQRQSLKAVEYGGLILRLEGCHMTPLVDPVTVQKVLEFIMLDMRRTAPSAPNQYELAA